MEGAAGLQGTNNTSGLVSLERQGIQEGGEKMSGFKCYGVSKGRGVGIFGTWKECREMVKDFPGARYRGFYSRADAEKWLVYEGIQERAGSRQHNDG